MNVPIRENDLAVFPDGTVGTADGKVLRGVILAGSLTEATPATATAALDFINRYVVDGQTYKARLEFGEAFGANYTIRVYRPDDGLEPPVSKLNAAQVAIRVAQKGQQTAARELKSDLGIF